MQQPPQRLLAVLVASCWRCALAAEAPGTLHVHPAGSDADAQPGTEAAPLRTPHAARDRLRLLPPGPKQVVLHAGNYPPLRLTAADSGTAEHPVRWRGRPGSTLSAGVPLPPSLFKPRSPGDRVLVANLSGVPGLPADFGSIEHASGVRGCVNNRTELFVGPHRMPLARFPNLDVDSQTGAISWSLNWMRANGNCKMLMLSRFVCCPSR